MKNSEILDIKNKIEHFVLDEAWVGEFLLDCFFNKQFAKRALNAIDILSSIEIKSEDIDRVLQQFKNTSKYYFYKYRKTNNVDDLMNAETYWMFIELATNNSILTKNIQQELIKIYGDNYLHRLKDIDALKQSIYYKENSKYLNCEKKYICIKKWQDVQHFFVSDGRLDYLYSQMDKFYPKLLVSNTNFNYKFSHYLTKILDRSYSTIEDYSKLFLVHPTYDYNNLIGGKAYGLIKLYSLGLNVPYAYFTDCYSEDLLNVIDKRKHYAVRSSADIEDGQNNSFAGIFDSILNVEYKNLGQAICEVTNSLYSERAQSYYNHINLVRKPKMHLVIQEFINPDIAGVWMGDKEDLNAGLLEYVEGCGEGLVSGQKNPIRYIYKNNNSENSLQNIISKKMVEVQYKLRVASDIEWCYKNGVLYFLQARYVTTDIGMMFNQYDFNETDYKATPASPGIAVGRPILLNSVKEFVEPLGDEILLTWFTDPEWVPIMKKFKGVVTAVGGFLSHAAIICREMNLPCVVEMNKTELFMLKDVKKIKINGSNGSIKILER